MTETLRSWTILFLMLAFVTLYALVLIGILRPVTDITVITRIEPIVFIVIGFLFGRLPAGCPRQSPENENARHSTRVDTAQDCANKLETGGKGFDEKLASVRAVSMSCEGNAQHRTHDREFEKFDTMPRLSKPATSDQSFLTAIGTVSSR